MNLSCFCFDFFFWEKSELNNFENNYIKKITKFQIEEKVIFLTHQTK